MANSPSKISITGSGGFVGKYLKSSLVKNGFEINPIKSSLDIYQLDPYKSYLSPILKDSKAIIILGWNTRNRRLDAQIDSVLQTIEVIKVCIKESIKIIFVSTYNSSINSLSNYCRMKFEVESYLRNSGYSNFYIIRPGLLYGDNMEMSRKRTRLSLLNFQINFRNPGVQVKFQSLSDFVFNQVLPILNGEELSLREVGGEVIDLQIPMITKNKKFKISINTKIFLKLLKLLSPVHVNFYNLYDSFLSVLETGKNAKN